MQNKVCLACALLSGVALLAQTQNPPAAQPVPPQVLKTHTYIRRISAGATLSVLVLKVVPDSSLNTFTTSPVADNLYTTTGMLYRVGWGGQVQAAITERLAVNAGLIVRRTGYKMNSDIIEGQDNPNTTIDDRTHITKNEDTRAKFFDFPVVVRFYTGGRHSAKPNWFFEGGAALRRVSKIRTSIDSTRNSEDTVCCDTTPATPAARTIRGFVGGFGVQIIDPVGVRIVPQVRYTRWVGRTFDLNSTHTLNNQVEAMVSLTF